MERELTLEEEIMKDYYIKKASGYSVPAEDTASRKAKVQQALQTIVEDLKSDTTVNSTYEIWDNNLQVAFLDAWERWSKELVGRNATYDHRTHIAKEAAKNFLNQFIR